MSEPTPLSKAQLTVSEPDAATRLDVFLARSFPAHSRADLQRLIREEYVRRNDRPSRPSQSLHTGDLIDITFPPEPQFELKPESMALDILLEDSDILVINKPAGLVVHPGKGNWTGTLVQGLLAHAEADFTGMIADDELRPGIVHRLDKGTSGCLVIAKNPTAREGLRRAFEDRLVKKTYLALATAGPLPGVTGVVLGNIGRHPVDRAKMDVLRQGGKPAETHYRVREFRDGISLVEVNIVTGRTHQIRVHLAHIRHPVLGDPVYGGRKHELPVHPDRQMLHAWCLGFPHPRSGAPISCIAPVPADFLAVLATLGFATPEAPTEA